MSYSDVTFNFPDSGMIAIYGKNGAGKSSLLEGVPYMLFGIAKVAVKKLVRCGKKTFHGWIVFNSNGKDYEVERTIQREDTKTALFLRDGIGGDIISEGMRAQTVIDNLVGIDGWKFMLTSFFGAGKNDSLMNVTPSARLEALQKIANVDIFKDYKKKVDNKKKEIDVDVSRLTGFISAKKECLIDTLPVLEQIESIKLELKNINSEINNLLTLKKKYSSELKTVSRMLAEKETEENNILNTEKEISENKLKLVNCGDEIESNSKRLESLRIDFPTIKRKVDNLPDINEVNSKIEKLTTEKSRLQANIDLYHSLNCSELGVDGCPVCKSNVTLDGKEEWKKKLSIFKADWLTIEDDLSIQIITKKKIECALNELGVLEEEIKYSLELSDSYSKNKSNIENDHYGLESKINAFHERLKKIKKELKFSGDIPDKLSMVDNDLSKYQKREGELETSIKMMSEKITTNTLIQEDIKNHDGILEENFKDITALNELSRSYSRYGIPYDLLVGLRLHIEEEGTKILNNFLDGSIQIEDVELRGKPGIVFNYVGINGVIEYDLLSTGQKVIIGLCVRLAISIIIRRTCPLYLDILVLDEVAGELDVEKRDQLVKAILKVLRNYFKQLFVVSHVELADFFTHEYTIQEDIGGSLING